MTIGHKSFKEKIIAIISVPTKVLWFSHLWKKIGKRKLGKKIVWSIPFKVLFDSVLPYILGEVTDPKVSGLADHLDGRFLQMSRPMRL